MGKFNLKNMLGASKIFVDKHSPEILTSVGIAGMVTSTILAVRATPRALDLIEDKKDELDTNELTKREIIQACWKCYVPAIITGGAAITCIVGASRINSRRNVMLATAYNLTERALTEYKDKVVEVIGEEKEKEIREEIAKDRIERKPMTDVVFMSEKGNTLCYDSISGRYFKSDAEKIRKAENLLNKQLMGETYVSLNDFYDYIGLPYTQIGFDLGWKFDGDMIEIAFDTCLNEDDQPCLVLDYSIEPKYDYQKLI